MALEPKQWLYMGIGFLDYVRDKLEELQDELIRRGEEKSENFRDFLGDLIENIPYLKSDSSPESEPEETDEETGGLRGILGDLDLKSTIGDLLDSAGLATGDDILQLNERLERLGRAAGNLETLPRERA